MAQCVFREYPESSRWPQGAPQCRAILARMESDQVNVLSPLTRGNARLLRWSEAVVLPRCRRHTVRPPLPAGHGDSPTKSEGRHQTSRWCLPSPHGGYAIRVVAV
ncbi:hypothetical protein GCM10009533_51540 [Saccharopolyspora spinosporotrichia]|uniref:Uncharacterized protein n=1 Tax=Saccharopolyspora erythraea TaxID=1836 RepID=A0ABN1DM46_SACER